jgi:hydroxyethylthiazole kinase-like uncharacterized protein yjeF
MRYRPIPPPPYAAAVLTAAEMAQADRLAVASGTPSLALMEAAGAAVARSVLDSQGAGAAFGARPVALFCGPGNNGGDGLVAARLLRGEGVEVRVGLLAPAAALAGDARMAAERYGGPFVTLADLPIDDSLVVDALFGTGLARPLGGAAAEAVARINAAPGPIIAVDVPSGLDASSGKILGEAVVEADATVTFFRRKTGHLLLPGRLLCGRVEVADIGIAESVLATIAPATFAAGPLLWLHRLPQPAAMGHKYDRGHALVVSGGPTSTGAARLAAGAALRAGSGLVTLASPSEALGVNAAHLTAVMLTRVDGAGDLGLLLNDRRKTAILLGPGLGLGEPTRALVVAALAPAAHYRAAVLDADALTSYAGRLAALATLIAAAPGPVILTPHEGEFDRLFAAEPAVAAAPSKLARARAAAQRSGALVILKGADTVIADPDGRAAILEAAPAYLATAGAGDVLAGIVCGLVAQAMAPFEAAAAAAYLHAAAAAQFGPGLIAEDLPRLLPKVLARYAKPGPGDA